MTWQFTSIALIYLLSALICLFTAVINWRQRHTRKGVALLSLLFFMSSLWLAGWFVQLSIVEPVIKQFMLSIEDSLGELSYLLFLFFVLDYFSLWPWFDNRFRKSLWFIWASISAIGWTNPFHHLFWDGFTPGPPESNIIFFDHGPLLFLSTIFSASLIILSLSLLGYNTVKSKGRERQTSLFVTVAMAAPFYTFLVFTLLPDQFTGLLAVPFGFALTAILIDWAVVEDFRFDLSEKKNGLEFSLFNLKQEIVKKENVEKELRQSQEFLSMKLAAQSSKLTGVYDLILSNGKSPGHAELIQTSLTKITSVLGCQATIYFSLDTEQKLTMEAWHGIGLNPEALAIPIRSDWLPATTDVRAHISIKDSIDLPAELKQENFDASLFKWVIVQYRPLGILAAYWSQNQSFAVEEIALFGALTDGLGLIVENARLRQVGVNEATLQERRRLARDLHDSVTQSLHSLVLSSQTALEETQNPDRLKRILRGLDTGARQALKEMRLLLFELRLAQIAKIKLIESLQNRLEAVEHRAGIQAELILDPGACWPKEWEADLYPLAMEALNNSLKHARATKVKIHFINTPQEMQIEIMDDGLGFDMNTLPPGGMGLKNMNERCQKIGAQLEIITHPSEGTIIRVKYKIPDKPEPILLDKA